CCRGGVVSLIQWLAVDVKGGVADVGLEVLHQFVVVAATKYGTQSVAGLDAQMCAVRTHRKCPFVWLPVSLAESVARRRANAEVSSGDVRPDTGLPLFQ